MTTKHRAAIVKLNANSSRRKLKKMSLYEIYFNSLCNVILIKEIE